MGEGTKISWTDSTFNPWIGCTKVSPGCDHCYAETLERRWGRDTWGKGKPRRVTSDSNWHLPVKWNKQARELGIKQLVFCASLADVMDDEAPQGARERLWALIDATPNLVWQLLTKRPHRYERYLPKVGFLHNNVWLGTSAENQHYYDIRWPVLREIAGEHRLTSFISYEPALGPLKIEPWAFERSQGPYTYRLTPDWIIFGGESGTSRRPMQLAWAESLKQECENWKTSFWMKQVGARTPEEGSKLIPAHLLLRQFPESYEREVHAAPKSNPVR